MKKGRIARLRSLGGTAARVGGRLVRAQQRLAAEELAASLGELKGLPMKLGQMMSYLEEVMPEEHAEVWQEVLGKLQAHNEPVPNEQVLGVVEDALGAIDDHFERFDPEPIAAASIGQVYAARGHDGRDVVVKVQYPGVREAIASDLANSGTLAGVFQRVLRTDLSDIVRAVGERLLAECDYEHEAEAQERMRALWADEPAIVVPEVHRDLSSDRVLVSQRVHGLEWEDARRAPLAERQAWAETLYRFFFASLWHHGIFQADPHPGNFLFKADGGVAFLDFGAVTVYPPHIAEALTELRDLAIAGTLSGPVFRDALRRSLSFPDDLHPRVLEHLDAYGTAVMRPLSPPQPRKIDREHVREVMKLTFEAKQALGLHALRHGLPRFEHAEVLLMGRVTFGLGSLLAHLDAESDWASLVS